MTKVELFYGDLDESARECEEASSGLLFDVSRIGGGDFGVEAPVGRHGLQVEVHSRIVELHDAAATHGDAGSALAASLFAIAATYSELDEELAGEGAP
ncbi:hypothetical protein AB0E56_00855 [Microbacterium sp. NPDC028030]|uniref:hypothetical protein n=1 Tax=Microbacterium sp. NPDC028030 TaxID=3155124 RepID=UPI0033CE3986